MSAAALADTAVPLHEINIGEEYRRVVGGPPDDGKRYGCTEPRIVTPPLRLLTPETSYGFRVIEFATDVLRVHLYPWQRSFVIRLLEMTPDGALRFQTAVLLVGRQNGKSTISKVLALWFMLEAGWPLVLGTAQDLETAEEIWEDVVNLLTEETDDADDDLSDLVEKVIQVNGKKTLILANGTRYKVKAANRAAGRGLSGNLVMLDELREQKNWGAWGAITKTTQAQDFALVLGLSNAGDALSVVLAYLRKMAHAAVGDPDGINKVLPAAGPTVLDVEAALEEDDELYDDDDPEDWEQDEDTLFLAEYSATPGIDRRERDGWAQSNPLLGYRIRERKLASDCRTDPEWVFRCLDVATPILTVHGWKPMGEVGRGDWVKGTSGDWIEVLGESPVHKGRDCYRVTLNDGRSIVCDDSHLWTVQDRRRTGRFETATTAELVRRGVTYRNPSTDFDVRNYTLPVVDPLDGPDAAVPIHPYLLGLWLGDGAKHAALVFSEDQDTDHLVRMIEAAGAVITTRSKDSEHCDRIGFRASRYGDFTGGLRELGVLNAKHIPDLYLVASREQRLWLLRGLMDSDGTVSARTGRCTFTNTNARLVEGVRTLVRSLGWKTSDLEAGEYGHRPRLDVAFTPRPDQPAPVTIPRKLERIRSAKGSRDVRPITIAAIEPVPSVPVKCIKVDVGDSLFLAGDLVPTHNTEVLCQWPDGTIDGIFPPGSWEDTTNEPEKLEDGTQRVAEADRLVGPVWVGLDKSENRAQTWVTFAGARADGTAQVEVRAVRHGDDWVKAYLLEHEWRDRFQAVTGQSKGAPISSLLTDLDEDPTFDVPVVPWQGSAFVGAFGDAYEDVRDGRVRHNTQPPLDTAAATAERKQLGDNWVIDRKKSPSDVAPLIAWIAALWLMKQRPAIKPPPAAPAVLDAGPEHADADSSDSLTSDLADIGF